MVMKPKITLKVAQVVDNEGASFSALLLGVETGGGCRLCGSSADHDSFGGN